MAAAQKPYESVTNTASKSVKLFPPADSQLRTLRAKDASQRGRPFDSE